MPGGQAGSKEVGLLSTRWANPLSTVPPWRKRKTRQHRVLVAFGLPGSIPGGGTFFWHFSRRFARSSERMRAGPVQLGLESGTVYGILMSKSDKLLERMRRNPRDGWSIDDVCTVCNQFGLTATAPKRGSHYKISHPAHPEILTIPSKRPIKPPYIRALVALILRVVGENGNE